jgi:hypothetical protein
VNGEFQDRIEEALVSVHGPHSRLAVDMDALAAAVLAMPEMQAIRGGILALFTAYDWDRTRCAEALSELGFPQSVIDWVMGGPSLPDHIVVQLRRRAKSLDARDMPILGTAADAIEARLRHHRTHYQRGPS